MPAHYFPQVLCIFSAQKRGAQRTSGCLLVLFFSLFPEQPHELLAHTIQTLLSKQLLFSSWALLYCSLLQYLKCFTNIKVLIFMPFTWTCNNSTSQFRERGWKYSHLHTQMEAWEFGFQHNQTIPLSWSCTVPAFCQHGSCAFLGTWACPHSQCLWNSACQRWGGSTAF